MKFKSKAWIGFLVIATIGWPILAPGYRPGQVILAAAFAYIDIRLFAAVITSGSGIFIYSKLEEIEEDEVI